VVKEVVHLTTGELKATYKSGKANAEVKASTLIEANKVAVVTTDVQRSIVYYPFWPRDHPYLDIPLNRAPSTSNVGRVYLPGPNGGIDLRGYISGNLLQACLDSPPPEAGLYSNGKFTPVLNGTALDQVSLQLTAKHHWILAVLTIPAGVLSAFVVQRYIGVTRVLRSLRERTAAALALVPKKDLDAGLQLRSIAEAAARLVRRRTTDLDKGFISRLGAYDQGLKLVASDVALA